MILEATQKSLVILPEACHDCKILARVIELLTADSNSTTIPIIFACTKYTQETVISGDFPGRELLYFRKDMKYVNDYLVPNARISGKASAAHLYGEDVICPLNLP